MTSEEIIELINNYGAAEHTAGMFALSGNDDVKNRTIKESLALEERLIKAIKQFEANAFQRGYLKRDLHKPIAKDTEGNIHELRGKHDN